MSGPIALSESNLKVFVTSSLKNKLLQLNYDLYMTIHILIVPLVKRVTVQGGECYDWNKLCL